MAKYNLQDMAVGATFFVFIIIFGTSLVVTHVDNYNVNIDPTVGVNYGTYKNNLSTYKNEVEDEDSNFKVTEGDTEGILGTIGTIRKVFGIRGTVTDLSNDVEKRFFFLPKEFWEFLAIFLGIIFITVVAGIFWRNREGISG